MFTGALAVSYYGTPRTTMDIDIIIQIIDQKTEDLIKALHDAKIKIRLEDIQKSRESGYNIISLNDTETPYTIDIILSIEPLQKRECTILNQPTYIQTPENLILAKYV